MELNTETLPRVLVNQTYYATVAKARARASDKAYFADCLQTANWLVKSLDQRARTILKVATEIVRQQDGFFADGVAHLRPLNLQGGRRRDQHARIDGVARHRQQVHRHPARHLRAEIFLHRGDRLGRRRRGAFGRSRAPPHPPDDRRREPRAAMLSDDAIVDKLREGGIDIARRTVAKYREAMRIPSSVQRRRDKQARRRSTRSLRQKAPVCRL